MCFMYSALIPLAMPIFTIGLLLNFVCKRYIILHYTVRIPADESLSQKVITLLPFIILVHGLMGVWGRTADGIFDSSAFFIKLDLGYHNKYLDRAVSDIILLGASGLILVWIIFDFTVVNFCGALK